jgi:putative dehydrogenase
MAPPIVSIVAQGAMGAATAARLSAHGVQVRTSLEERSPASRERAVKAAMTDVGHHELAAADFFLSIVPPNHAVALAERLAPALSTAPSKPVYVDLNAINPETAKKVAKIIEGTGAPFADGGIIGPPPREDRDGPVYYVSGPDAARVAALCDFGLKVDVLGGPVGTASALKMSYAGVNKGLIAIASAMILAASRAGVADALHAQLADSQPNLLARLNRSVPDMFDKAYRWGPEMQEIAGFIGDGGTGGEIYTAIARLYDRLGEDNANDKREISALDAFFSGA